MSDWKSRLKTNRLGDHDPAELLPGFSLDAAWARSLFHSGSASSDSTKAAGSKGTRSSSPSPRPT